MGRPSREPPQPDLLAWPALRDAEMRVVEAAEARRAAERRYRLAPYGERDNRLRAFQEASAEALRADLHLAQLRETVS